MKKALIAGAASVALAAMPVVGAFAATTSSVVDTVRLTVSEACKMEADASANTYNLGTQAAGNSYAATAGTPMTITCNTRAGWSITAGATALADKSETNATTQTIPYGAYADGSTPTSSVWSAKIALSGNNTGNATIASGYGDYTATTLATGTTIVSGNSDTAVSGLVVTPSYKAYAAADQAAATYEGTITYTFVGATN